MEKTNVEITRYKDRDFYIDVVRNKTKPDNEDIIEAWLTHEKYGVMDYMFGLPVYQPELKTTTTYEEAIGIIEGNLPQYEASYLCDRFEEDILREDVICPECFDNYIRELTDSTSDKELENTKKQILKKGILFPDFDNKYNLQEYQMFSKLYNVDSKKYFGVSSVIEICQKVIYKKTVVEINIIGYIINANESNAANS